MVSGDNESIIKQAKNASDPFIKAKHIRQLIRDRGFRLKELSRLLENKESYVCHLLRLLKLPEIVVDGFYSSHVSVSHLFIISRLPDVKSMVEMFETVLANSYTVSQTELAVREKLYGVKSKGQYLTQSEITELIPLQFGAMVRIIQSRIKSKIIFTIEGDLVDTSSTIKKILGKLK